MKVDSKDYQYAVVNFLKQPHKDIAEFVCIPHSWIRIRRVTEEQSIVAYPNERPSVTQRRIEDGEKPSKNWELYPAVVKFETYTSEDARFYILEKKYGVAADDLCTSVNTRKQPIKRLQPTESQFEKTMSKLGVVKVTTGDSSEKKISTENTFNMSNKSPCTSFVYPYHQQIPDYCRENSSESDCEVIVRKPSYISRDLLNSMKEHLLKSPQLSNQNQFTNTDDKIQISKVPEVDQVEQSSAAEPPQISLSDRRFQDSDIQPMIVDEPEETEDTKVAEMQDDDSVRSSSPEMSTEKTDQPVGYPIDKVRTQANFIANLLETMETSHLRSSERILEVHKSFEQSIELLKLIKHSYNSKKLEQIQEKQTEVETPDADMRSDNVKSSSNDDEDEYEDDSEDNSEDDSEDNSEDDSEDDDVKAPKKSCNSLRSFVLPPEYDPKDTRWTLKYRENDPKLGLVELVPGSNVFLSHIRLAHCKRVSKDCKTLARMLLAEIFSQSALAVCSLTGAKANAFHNNGTYVRPGLDADARTTMFAYVEDYARDKQWAAYDKQSVINSVRSRVQEIRTKHART